MKKLLTLAVALSLSNLCLAAPPDVNRRACEIYHDGAACLALAHQYENGLGILKSLHEARRFYEKGCEHRNGLACNRLGDFYQHGIGVRPSRLRADEYYHRARKFGGHPVDPRLRRH